MMMMKSSSSCALCAVNKSDEKSPLKKGPPLFISPSSLFFETLNTRGKKRGRGNFLFFFLHFVVLLSHTITQHKVVCRLSSAKTRACESLRRETTDSLSLSFVVTFFRDDDSLNTNNGRDDDDDRYKSEKDPLRGELLVSSASSSTEKRR